MRQPDTEIDLDALVAAIEASIRATFPDLALVEAWREDRTNLPVPACLIDLVDLEPVEDIGTEQLPVQARFEARIITGFREPDAKRLTLKRAAALGLHVRGQRWGQPVAPAEVTSIERDEFDPDMDAYEIWRVDWQQVIHIGASVWDNEGVTPTEVVFSTAPDIGPGNEGSYAPLAEVTE